MKVKYFVFYWEVHVKYLNEVNSSSKKLTAEIRSSAFAVCTEHHDTRGALKRDKNDIHPNQNLDVSFLKKTQATINSAALSQHTSVSMPYLFTHPILKHIARS